MKISIIVPVFNEEKTILKVLQKLSSLEFPSMIIKEVIVVDDGSTDRTRALLKSFQLPDFKIISFKKNQGKGSALREGIKRARGDIIAIQDADLEYNPKDLLRLIKPILRGRSLVVYGNRFAKYPLKFWGNQRTILPSHWIGNKALTGLTNFLYGVRLSDMETCYKMVTKEVVSQLRLVSNRFEIEPEITAKILKKGYKILEIPIKVKPRTHKMGKKIHWHDGVTAVWTLVKYRFFD